MSADKAAKRAFDFSIVKYAAVIIICILLGSFALGYGGIGIIAAVLLFAVSLFCAMGLISCPVVYVFDSEKLVIVYSLGYKETIEWNSVERIKLNGTFSSKSVYIEYIITYHPKKKRPFFANGKMIYRERTKLLLKEFYGEVF